MRAYGSTGAVVAARASVDLPTEPFRRPPDWPPPVDRRRWTSPIGPPRDPEATRAAERAAAQALVDEAKAAAARAAKRTEPKHAAAGPRPEPRPDASSRRDAAAAAEAALVDELRIRWEAGEPQAFIAEALGISVTKLQRLRRKHGVPRRNQAIDGETVVRLYVEERLGIERIAARLGTSSAAVRYRLIRAGVTMRPAGGRGSGLGEDVRAAALLRIAAGARPVDVRRDLGVSESTLLRWRAAAADEQSVGA